LHGLKFREHLLDVADTLKKDCARNACRKRVLQIPNDVQALGTVISARPLSKKCRGKRANILGYSD